ncbi:uncharacterized protein LOC143074158 [Mytilus galloprovincialis]|uniref:uncharacterized protein LOC143074158 n=1 Tax=Mytilus galloprovincialis TaxID=29158 RepID=UPI003F7B3B65
MTLDGQNRKEATQLRLLNSKSATKIGTWNVRSMYIPGKAQTIANEMKAYEIGILGIAEARWNDAGQSKLTSGEMIIYSGHMEENAQHSEGVAIMLSKEAQKTLIGWEPISARIIRAKFKTTNKRISLNIIQCYAPTNGAEDNIKEEFYQLLEETTRKCSSKDITILMGDLNAKNAAEEIISIEDHWQEIKNAFTTACETSVGLKNRKHQEWITPETLVKVEKRKNIKNILNNSKTRSAKQSASREYTIANKDVRNSARRDKRAFVDKLTAEAEEAARANNIKALYDNIKLLTGKYQKGSRPVKSKEGKTLNTHEEQMKRWVEHFKDVLNQDPPVRKADIPPSEELLAVDCKRPSTGEIKKAIKMLKNNKAPGPDNIPAEALKADIETSTQMLYELFGKIWEEEEVPLEWKEGHMQQHT